MSDNLNTLEFENFKIIIDDDENSFYFQLKDKSQIGKALDFINIEILKIVISQQHGELMDLSEENENIEIYKNLMVYIPNPKDNEDILYFTIKKSKNQQQYFNKLKILIVEYFKWTNFKN